MRNTKHFFLSVTTSLYLYLQEQMVVMEAVEGMRCECPKLKRKGVWEKDLNHVSFVRQTCYLVKLAQAIEEQCTDSLRENQ